MDVEQPLGVPLGRRLFLGLMGVGAAGLVGGRFLYAGDDATAQTVAEAVPLGGMRVETREPREGQHPNTVFSERFRFYSVGEVPKFNHYTWRLTIDGEGARSQRNLTYNEVRAFPNYAIKATFRCVTGWRVRDCTWRGVRVRDVLASADPNGRAKFVTFYANDGVYADSLSWDQAKSTNALLAWDLNGDQLSAEQGFPLRLIYPDMYGYKNVKWVHRLELKSSRDLGFWEQNGWEVDAYVYNPPSRT